VIALPGTATTRNGAFGGMFGKLDGRKVVLMLEQARSNMIAVRDLRKVYHMGTCRSRRCEG